MKIPLAYLITFTCYGNWLHGDERGSVDQDHNAFGSPLLAPNRDRKDIGTQQLKSSPVKLNVPMREIVTKTIQEVCAYRDWTLYELNVRSNHVHIVVSEMVEPNKIMKDLKAYATRRLAEAGEVPKGQKVWTGAISLRGNIICAKTFFVVSFFQHFIFGSTEIAERRREGGERKFFSKILRVPPFPPLITKLNDEKIQEMENINKVGM